jgi:hypothetical protein
LGRERLFIEEERSDREKKRKRKVKKNTEKGNRRGMVIPIHSRKNKSKRLHFSNINATMVFEFLRSAV